MAETIKTRRTHWQALAHKRYRRMHYVSGDGEWLIMTKCHMSGTDRWCYWLYETYDDAIATLTEFTALGCASYQCGGSSEHRMWRLT